MLNSIKQRDGLYYVEGICTTEEKNYMVEAGFHYMVLGDFEYVEDSPSGGQDVRHNIYFFRDPKEADAFAKKQKYPGTGECSSVEELRREKTYEEQKAEAAERKKRADINAAKRYDMPLEDYLALKPYIESAKRELAKAKNEEEKARELSASARRHREEAASIIQKHGITEEMISGGKSRKK